MRGVWNQSQVIDDFETLIGKKTDSSGLPSRRIKHCPEIRAVFERELRIEIDPIGPKMWDLFARLVRAAVGKYEGREGRHLTLAGKEAVGLTDLTSTEIADLLSPAPTGLREGTIEKGYSARPVRIFLAGQQLKNGVTERTARDYIPEMAEELAHALHKFLDSHLDEACQIATQLGYGADSSQEETSVAGIAAVDGLATQAPTFQQAARHALCDLGNSFRIISPDPDKPANWQSVLDGSTLTINHAAQLDAVIERRAIFHDSEYSIDRMLDFLTAQRGQTFFLSGDRGDGKSSYLNLLAARSQATHVFLRWKQDSPISIHDLESYRRSVQSLSSVSSSSTPCIVVVCSLPLYGDSNTEWALTKELQAHRHDGHGLVVLVEGRPAELSRVQGQVGGYEIRLARIDRAEAKALADRIERAHSSIVSSGFMPETAVGNAYPNLHRFLNSSEDERIETLTRDSPTLLIGLLRAVYGDDMWRVLVQEFDNLSEPDRKAYLHVCLASMVGRQLPHQMLAAMAGGADLHARSQRDPWCEDDGEYRARHPLIAQVVLEQVSSKEAVLLRKCIGDYVLLAGRPGSYLDVLCDVLSGLDAMTPVASEGGHKKLKQLIQKCARNHITTATRFSGTVVAESRHEYRYLTRWARVLKELVPESSRDVEQFGALIDDALELIDLAIRWTASGSGNDSEVERLRYYRTKCQCVKKKLNLVAKGGLGFSTLYDAVEYVSDFVKSDWCGPDFYIDLFWWSDNALNYIVPRGEENDLDLIPPDVEEIVFLYQMMSESWERLRAKFPDAVEEQMPRKYGRWGNRLLNEYVPKERVTDLIREAWELSISLGRPNAATGANYGERLIYSTVNPDAGILAQAMAALRRSLDANPMRPKAVYLMAYCHEKSGSAIDDLAERVDLAADADDTHINRAFLAHAKVALYSENEEREQLLRRALREYRTAYDRPSPRNHPNWIFDTINAAWDHACRQLSEIDAQGSQKHRHEYERVRRTSLMLDEQGN